MSVQTKATLKSYFETGDKPTQANFEDLIDSLLDQSDGFKNGGNSLGADASLGTNDNYNLIFKTNNAARWTVREDGRIQKDGSNPALTHDISTDNIGATGYSGSKIAFSGSVTISANNNVILGLGNGNLQFNTVSNFVIEQLSKSGTNVAGTDAYIKSQRGTGNTTPTSIIFQTPTVGSSGTTVQSLATRLTLNSTAATFETDIDLIGSLRLDDSGVKKVGLNVSSGSLRLGGGFSTLLIVPPTINLSNATTIGSSNGSITIRTTTTDNSTVTISAVGGDSTSNGVILSSSSTLTTTSGSRAIVTLNPSFAPTSGTGNLDNLKITPIYNQTGGANGTLRGIYYNPTTTSVLGPHYAFQATSGQMLMPSGSSSLPSYTFGSGTNTGIFYNTSENNGIGFAYNGTRIMNLTNGNLAVYTNVLATGTGTFGGFLYVNTSSGGGVGGTISVISQWSGANGYVLKANASDYSGNPYVYNNSSGTTLFKVNSAGDIITNATTASASTTTGALVVAGGAGIAGDVYIGGNLSNTSTGFLQIAAGTTAQQPTAVNGMFRYDTTTNKIRAVENGSWVDVISSGTSSPLTTKGDLWGFSTVDARIPVGSDDQFLIADSSQAAGVVWKKPKFYYADDSGTSTSAFWFTSAGTSGFHYGGGDISVRRSGIHWLTFTNSYMLMLHATISNGYNFGIGATSWGTSAGNVMAHKNGTAPSTSVTDCYQLYAADVVAGNASPHFKTENGDVIKLYKQTALTAADSNSPNSGDGTTDTLISNMRTRIYELETRLQNLGLL